MRVPMSWLTEYVDLPAGVTARDVAARLVDAGLKVEHVDEVGEDVSGVVVARVHAVEELSGFKKPIRWVTVETGDEQRQVICGATNFAVGDLVAYARPPAMLPGGARIDRRPAYGRESDGMICSARELGLGDDHAGILVLGADVALGADVVDALALRDSVLDIAVNPDRGYALSVRGVAREVATAYGVAFRDPADVAVASPGDAGWPVTIEDRDGCDRYVAVRIDAVDPSAASPMWLQRRVTLAGMRPVSLAVDVTNAVMLEVGQPLHAFDADKLRGGIVVRRAKPGERIRTLDDVDRELSPDDLVIADDSGPVALAGVMGGARTEIGQGTTSVLLESAHFDVVSVARTARRHKLPSEASRRFERGVDDAVSPAAAQRAADLLTQLAGARIGPVSDVDLRATRPRIELDPRLPGRLAGTPYDDAVVRRRLADVGCAVDDSAADRWSVQPPSWRPDLRRDVDLVEEVTRLEGYDRLPVTVPSAPAGRGLTHAQRQRRQVGRSLAASGFAEVVTYPFAADYGDALQLDADDPRRPSVGLASPVSDAEPFLRATLLPGLLAALARNVNRGRADVALFEAGPVFRWQQGHPAAPSLPAARRPDATDLAALEAALPDQPWHVATAACGTWERAGWWGGGRAVSWADAVESVRAVGRAVGVTVEVAAATAAPWHPGRCAALLVDGVVVGHAGELHPRVLDALDLPPRTVAMEAALAPVLAASPDVVASPYVSAFPAATLDVAVVVPDGVAAADVAAALRDGAGPLLEDLRLFDVFTGSQVGDGRRSLAFSLRLRARDRTLTAEEAAAVRDGAVAEAARRVGAVLRGA